MNWNDAEARARLLEQVGPHEFARQWNRHYMRTRCTHNAMVPNDSQTHVWRCADCGHVYVGMPS